MTYFLLAVTFLLCTIHAPQPVSATATLSVNITPGLNPGETYANAWAAAGPTPTVAQACVDPVGKSGIRSSAGSLVECPTGAKTGSLKIATAPTGDKATASAWAWISGGVGNAFAPVNIPLKPQSFAGAAAYAKANSAIPKEAKGAGKIGGVFSITYGNLTVNGWSEPVDAVTYIVVDDSPRGQLSNMLTKVLDEDSIESLKEEGYTFAQPTNVYFMIPIVLPGIPKGKPKVGKPFYFKEDLQKCPTNDILHRFQEKEKACLISEQVPSEKDFTPCQGRRCSSDELNYSLDRTFEVKFYIPGVDLTENVSVHEISCVKSRGPNQSPPVKNDDICSLVLRIPHGQSKQ